MDSNEFIRGDRVIFGAKDRKKCFGEFIRYNLVTKDLCYIKVTGRITGCCGIHFPETNKVVIGVSFVKHAPSRFKNNNPNITFKRGVKD